MMHAAIQERLPEKQYIERLNDTIRFLEAMEPNDLNQVWSPACVTIKKRFSLIGYLSHASNALCFSRLTPSHLPCFSQDASSG